MSPWHCTADTVGGRRHSRHNDAAENRSDHHEPSAIAGPMERIAGADDRTEKRGTDYCLQSRGKSDRQCRDHTAKSKAYRCQSAELGREDTDYNSWPKA